MKFRRGEHCGAGPALPTLKPSQLTVCGPRTTSVGFRGKMAPEQYQQQLELRGPWIKFELG